MHKENKDNDYSIISSLPCVFSTRSRYTMTRVVLLTQEPAFWHIKLNHWCHMDYFNDVLTMFLGLEHVSYVAVYAGSQKALRFHKKYFNLCSEDERRSYRFGTTWGRVINWQNFYFGETNPWSQWIFWMIKLPETKSMVNKLNFTFYCMA